MNQTNTWPGWECVRELGTGSFGSVYEICRREQGVEYRAALKVIRIPRDERELRAACNEGMDQKSATAYFRSIVDNITRECQLMASLKGQTHIVSYEDHMVMEHRGGMGWEVLIRMELLTPLMQYQETHPLSEGEVIRLGLDMCKALKLCEQKGIIHRDIKPANIFVNEFGDFVLGDFGVARNLSASTAAVTKAGTESYMAPEVYHGQRYDKRADIYSLGVVLFRYLNELRGPFLPLPPEPIRYEDRARAMVRRLSGEAVPAPLHGSSALQEVVRRACAFQPQERFGSAAEFSAALEAAGRGESLPREELEPTEYGTTILPTPDKKRELPLLSIGIGAAALLALILALVLGKGGGEAPSETPPVSGEVGQAEAETPATPDELELLEVPAEPVLPEEPAEETPPEAGVSYLSLDWRSLELPRGRAAVVTADVGQSAARFEGSLEWTSSDPGVASVTANGPLTAEAVYVGAGSCQIQCVYTGEGVSYTSRCDVLCIDEEGEVAGTQQEEKPKSRPQEVVAEEPVIVEALGTTYYGGHTYSVYNFRDLRLDSYRELRDFCEDQGGYLAAINSKEENKALYEFIQDCGLSVCAFGYSDEKSEGNWVWANGSKSAYENWADGQPNNGSANKDGREEDYAEFKKDGGGAWNDGPFGGNTHNFICEWGEEVEQTSDEPKEPDPKPDPNSGEIGGETNKTLDLSIRKKVFSGCGGTLAALGEDGTLMAVSENPEAGLYDGWDWKKLVSVATDGNTVYGLTKEGKVLGAGFETCGMEDWKDIVDIAPPSPWKRRGPSAWPSTPITMTWWQK